MVSGARGARRARELGRDATGLSTVEYILVLVLLAIAAILLWRFFGSSVEARIDQSIESVDTMNTVEGGGGSGGAGGMGGAGGAGGMGGAGGGGAGGGGAGGGAQPVNESGSSPTVAGSMGTSMGAGASSGTVISGSGSPGGSSAAGGGGGANPTRPGATASAYVAPGTDDESMDMFGMVGIIVLIIGFAIPIIVVIKKTRGGAA